MTYWEHDEAVQRFQHILEILGVRKSLAAAGIHEGNTRLYWRFRARVV